MKQKHKNLDILLIAAKKVESERQAARREAFQQMVRVLQAKAEPEVVNQVDNESIIESKPKYFAKAKTMSC
ncbi:MAG: hypothetical protein IPK14_18165 [Blastocatellia bacterium]|nr:hypothetical protein [Blastocatellia bacterium]MBL8196436.1 hypothetical protein [Blastocatellia bacterium]MBN8724415.1 hypothetical protein [Acidobacteriota bacterium]